jgi:peptide/nickel transport system substrate-binding protein
VLPLQSDNLTHDGLLTYRHVPGPAGAQLVPDLAVNLPEPADGGRTYTFRLRGGIRYSDGRPLRAADIGRGIQRTLRLRGDSSIAFAGLVGAEGCPRSCDLARGVVADEEARTVTFHLRSADPDFPAALALAAASAVPAGTPDGPAGSKPIPGTGPYKIAHASNREVRYVRNPDFHEWSHAAQPDGNPDAIVMRFGLSRDEALRAVERNQADVGSDNASPERLPELRRRYPSRLHAFTIPTTDFAQFNATIPPFDDVRVRRALNLAVDRRRIARMYGGADLATPTCQILPPGIPGHRTYCPYRGPDLARARRLVVASGTRGQRVVVWSWTDDPTITPAVARYVTSVLRRLGYDASTHLVPHEALHRAPERVFRHIQLVFAAWGDTPSGFFGNWFACSGSTNHGFYCDPKLDRMMRRAQVLKAARPRDAAALWERLDRTLTERAVWLPMINEHALDFVSERVRNYQVHPYWGVIVDQLWLR